MSNSNDKYLDNRTLTLNAASSGFGDLRAQNGATINNNAVLDILFDFPLQHPSGADTTFNNNGALIKSGGAGNIDLRADFINDGSVTVDSGSITFDRSYTQTAAGTLNVGIAGMMDFDSYTISETATLDGTLEVMLQGGFEPSLTEMYGILNFASRVGTFATENGLIIGNGKRFDITYGATDVTLEVVPDP